MLKNKLEFISYSNISTYVNCQHKWQKYYLQNLKLKKSTIDTVFGTAMHETIQQFLKEYYSSTEKIISQTTTKWIMYFIERLQYNRAKEQQEDVNLILFDQQVEQYANYGHDILKQFIPNVSKYFKKRGVQLYGIQIQLNQQIPWVEGIKFNGFLDIVLYYKNEDKYKIIDLKTSRNGWNDNQKKDETKRLQLQLYKYFFAQKLNIPLNKIQIEFMVLKKILFESPYKISRLQVFQPPSSDRTIESSVKSVKTIMQQMQKIQTGEIQAQKNVTRLCDWCPYSKQNDLYVCNKNRTLKR